MPPKRDEYTAWVYECMKEMEAVRVGMTREDLLKVFREQGGLSGPPRGNFYYRRCPYFLIGAEFDLFDKSRDAEGRPIRQPVWSDEQGEIHLFDRRDVITKISPVYVGLPDID